MLFRNKYNINYYPIYSKESQLKMTLSLFIPRIASNISVEEIKNVFWNLGYGTVSYVELQFYPTSRYGKAYVYFEYWFDTLFSKNFQKSVKQAIEHEKITVVYDAPHYWIVAQNKKHLNDEYDNEDAELEAILNEMDEVALLIPEADTSFVSSDYAEMLERENNYYIEGLQQSSYNQLFMIEKIKKMEQERTELRSELDHMKELLKQYEPVKRRQNKELYEF